MKTSKTVEESLAHLHSISTTGEIRTLIATVMFANARGELSNDTLVAQAKGGDAIANLMGAEVKVARAQIELRDKGAHLGKIAHMGQMLIGNAPQGG
jgi:hypothetical protein